MRNESCPTCLVAALLILVAAGDAQEMPTDQPPLWSTKPDIAASEKMENGRLLAAQAAIDQVVTVKGSRTIENTLRDMKSRRCSATAVSQKPRR
jgi:hypothetical protein